MANENFTTYTEVDPSSDIAVTAAKCDVTAMANNVEAYVRKDAGAAHFGDFEHLVKINVSTYGNEVTLGHWAITSSSNTLAEMAANSDGICVYAKRDWGTRTIVLMQQDDGWNNSDSYVTGEGTYYLTIERATTTITCKIYSDAARTNLLDTLTITGVTTAHRYIFGVMSGEGGGTDEATGYTEDLDLQEGIGQGTFRGVLLVTRGGIAPTAFGHTIAGMWAQVAYGNWKKLTGAATPVGSLVASKLDIVKMVLAGIATPVGAVLKMTSKHLLSKWIRPTSHTSTTKWTHVVNSYDDNTNTYATNTAADYDNYVELILSESIRCDKVRIYAEDVS